MNASGEYPVGDYTVEAAYEIHSNSTTVNMTGNEQITLTLEDFIIPEFPSLLILPLFMIITLLVAVAYKRKRFTWLSPLRISVGSKLLRAEPANALCACGSPLFPVEGWQPAWSFLPYARREPQPSPYNSEACMHVTFPVSITHFQRRRDRNLLNIRCILYSIVHIGRSLQPFLRIVISPICPNSFDSLDYRLRIGLWAFSSPIAFWKLA